MSAGNWGGSGGGSESSAGGKYGPPPGGDNQPPGGHGGPRGGSGVAPTPAGYPPGHDPQSGAGAVAWEDSSKGIISRLRATWKEALFTPRAFFARVAQNDKPGPSITFALATGVVAGTFFAIFIWPFYVVIGEIIRSWGDDGRHAGVNTSFLDLMFLVARGVFGLIGFPLIFALASPILPWIFGGAYHLMLTMMKGATKPVASTVRVTGYSNAATICMVVPGIGALMSIGSYLVLTVLGLHETHKCGTGKAAAAMLVPWLLFGGVCAKLYALAVAAGIF